MKWKKWKNVDRDLEKGEVIRIKISKDKYIYGRVRGGFGMSKVTIGKAIFLESVSDNFDDCRLGRSEIWKRVIRDLNKIEVLEEM